MELKTAYAFGRTVDLSYAEAEQKVREELSEGRIRCIDRDRCKEEIRRETAKEFRNYIILGACNPHLAYEALGREIDLGTLLPCNVVVYTRDDGKTVVMAMDPVAALGMVGNPEMTELAKTVAEKMRRVLAAL